MCNQPDPMQVLSLLFSNRAERERGLSERQYTATASVVTLNVAIVAGWLTLSSALTYWSKALGTLAVLAFNLVAIYYVYQKADLYWRCHDERVDIESKLQKLVSGGTSQAVPPHPLQPQRASSTLAAF